MQPELNSLVLPQDEQGILPECDARFLSRTYAGIPPWFGMLPPPEDRRLAPENLLAAECQQFARLDPYLKEITGSSSPYLFTYTLHDVVFGEEQFKQILAAKKLISEGRLTVDEVRSNARRRRAWLPLVEHPDMTDFVLEVFAILKHSGYFQSFNRIEIKLDTAIRMWEDLNLTRFLNDMPAGVGRLPVPYDLCSYRISENNLPLLEELEQVIVNSDLGFRSSLPYLESFAESKLGKIHQKNRVHTVLLAKMLLEVGEISLGYFQHLVKLCYSFGELRDLLGDMKIKLPYDYVSLADTVVDTIQNECGTFLPESPEPENSVVIRVNEYWE
jgi:hypothetical protein